MKNIMAITVQTTIARLGFMPDKLGAEVSEILESDNPARLMALGCRLEDYQKAGKYPDEEATIRFRLSIEIDISMGFSIKPKLRFVDWETYDTEDEAKRIGKEIESGSKDKELKVSGFRVSDVQRN